jgi:hypothetical protein
MDNLRSTCSLRGRRNRRTESAICACRAAWSALSTITLRYAAWLAHVTPAARTDPPNCV